MQYAELIGTVSFHHAAPVVEDCADLAVFQDADTGEVGMDAILFLHGGKTFDGNTDLSAPPFAGCDGNLCRVGCVPLVVGFAVLDDKIGHFAV